MEISELYKLHIDSRRETYTASLNLAKCDAVILAAGSPHTYFSDDQDAVFRPHAHFSHWCPDRSPHQLIKVIPGQKPQLARFRPKDFWHDHNHDDWWAEHFDLFDLNSIDEMWNHFDKDEHTAFIGADALRAKERNWAINPQNLVSSLDWDRGLKSDYEVASIRDANRIAALGHENARSCFASGGSELDIHLSYLAGVGSCEADLPYGTIVGLDEKAAVLHYQFKRRVKPGSLLLIDAGVSVRGYASDITRTYLKKNAPTPMADLLAGMERLQQNLCEAVRPDKSYVDLHASCHQQIAELLLECGVLQGLQASQVVKEGLSRTFFPHGLGHNLGLQVHDVSGMQKNRAGEACDKDERFPTQRTARPLRHTEVITIEPGLYFIPMLLNEQRDTNNSRYFNWKLIEHLQPFGGIRIEDNVFVDSKEPRNLTREFLGNDLMV